MKSYVKGAFVALFMSSALWPGVDKDRALMELEETRLAAFGEKPEGCIKANFDNIDEFLTAMSQIQDFVEEKGKNKLGIFDEKLKKATKALDEKTKELVVIVGAIHGTRTKDGLEKLKKLLKDYEDRLKEHEDILGKESFDDDKKKANEVLNEVIKSVKSLLSHVTKATDIRIKWLERPVKKKEKEKEKSDASAQEQKTKETSANDQGEAPVLKPKNEPKTDTLKRNNTPLYQNGVPRTPAQRRAAAERAARAVWLEHVWKPLKATKVKDELDADDESETKDENDENKTKDEGKTKDGL